MAGDRAPEDGEPGALIVAAAFADGGEADRELAPGEHRLDAPGSAAMP